LDSSVARNYGQVALTQTNAIKVEEVRTDPELVDEIQVHMESLTNIGANRTVIIRNYADRNPRELFKKRKTKDLRSLSKQPIFASSAILERVSKKN
jgi:hypothetical protein